jgi:hypothetical protein
MDLLIGIKPASFQLQFYFWKLEEVTECQMRGGVWVGDDNHFLFHHKRLGKDGSGEAATSVLVKVRGDVFASLHAVAAKRRSRTRHSLFGLLGPVFRATTTAV